MTEAEKQQYIETVRHLTAQKMKLAAVRAGEGADSGRESREAGVQRLSEELEKEENYFWEMSKTWIAKGSFLPLEYLCRLWNCPPFERHCLLLALGYEISPSMAGNCAYLHNDGSKDYITPWLAEITWHRETAFSDFSCAFLEETSFLKRFFRPAGETSPFMEHRLQLKKRIYSFLLWELEEEADLKGILTRWEPDMENISSNGNRQEMEILSLTRNQPDVAALLEDGIQMVELYGEEGVGRRYCAKAACAKLGRMAYLIRFQEIGAHREPFELLAERILLECLLFQAVPVVFLSEDFAGQEQFSKLKELVRRFSEGSQLVFVISRRPLSGELAGDGVKRLVLEVGDLSLLEKRQVWRQEGRHYSFAPGICIEEMANLFPFSHGKIKEALRQAAQHAKSRGSHVLDKHDLQRGCYCFCEQNLIKKAILIPPVYGWDDLVLPAIQKESILAACNQVRYKHKVYAEWGFEQKMPYGRGVSLIFAGPPGTGKTMAAQVFAAELCMDIYKVELSAVVSKYVGETEKNLELIFEQARQSQIVLFFDEADVLFSKRTEVKDANDKYNNMEAAFLLQKMEAYDGVTILATNLIQNFDEAFKRRVKFVIDFPFPDCARRRELWEKAFPAAMPVEELDLDYLASAFELSGSNIRNLVLHAAFLAASENKGIGMREILLAVKNEFAKSGKLLTKQEAGEYHTCLPEAW